MGSTRRFSIDCCCGGGGRCCWWYWCRLWRSCSRVTLRICGNRHRLSLHLKHSTISAFVVKAMPKPVKEERSALRIESTLSCKFGQVQKKHEFTLPRLKVIRVTKIKYDILWKKKVPPTYHVINEMSKQDHHSKLERSISPYATLAHYRHQTMSDLLAALSHKFKMIFWCVRIYMIIAMTIGFSPKSPYEPRRHAIVLYYHCEESSGVILHLRGPRMLVMGGLPQTCTWMQQALEVGPTHTLHRQYVWW